MFTRTALIARHDYGAAALTRLISEAHHLKGALQRQHSSYAYITSKITAILALINRLSPTIRQPLINQLIATILQLMSIPSFITCVFILERYWFVLHGTRPPRPILDLRPALG